MHRRLSKGFSANTLEERVNPLNPPAADIGPPSDRSIEIIDMDDAKDTVDAMECFPTPAGLKAQFAGMWHLLESGHLTDCAILAKAFDSQENISPAGATPAEIPAHRLVLIAACPALKRTILSDDFERTPIIDMTECSAWAVWIVLQFAYGQRVRIAANHLREVLQAAKQMGVKTLARQCKRHIWDLRIRKEESENQEVEAPGPSRSHSLDQRAPLPSIFDGTLDASLLRSRVIREPGAFQAKYEVQEEKHFLGEGMSGPVKLAVERSTGLQVAVKTLSTDNLSDVRRQMLMTEVDIYLRVSHPNIVRLLEVYEETECSALGCKPGGNVRLVMELCSGGELYERLSTRSRYTERDAARVARHMLYAVSYLHSHSICHRDLKLENWLYESPSEDAKLKLCDFGFGSYVHGSAPLTATLGSVHYVAPEVLDSHYGLSCDMWSIGVIVYMLLSGVPPFDGKTDRDIIQRVRNEKPATDGPRWTNVSHTAKLFVHSLLRRDPMERLTAAQALQHPWVNPDISSLNTEPSLLDKDVLRSIHSFARGNAIQRAALGLLVGRSSAATATSTDYMRSLEANFTAMDTHQTGTIDLEAFTTVIRRSFPEVSADEAGEIFASIALTNPREIHYRDFLAAAMAETHKWNWLSASAIREAFASFDRGNKGYITVDDFAAILGEDLGGRSIESIREHCSHQTKTEGILDFSEFAALLGEKRISLLDFADASDKEEGEEADTLKNRAFSALSRAISPKSPIHREIKEREENLEDFKEIVLRPRWQLRHHPVHFPAPPRLRTPPKEEDGLPSVVSQHSEMYSVVQAPYFHSSVLRPFYQRHRISNVVLGLIKGTSPFARSAQKYGVSQLIDCGPDGAFILIPNPKSHRSPAEVARRIRNIRLDPESVLPLDETQGRGEMGVLGFRFVAWWISPEHAETLALWYNSKGGRISPLSASDISGSSKHSRKSGSDTPFVSCREDEGREERRASGKLQRISLGAPGDFGFSNVEKSEHHWYLHTYRDLCTEQHLGMLRELQAGSKAFLSLLFGNKFLSKSQVSMGFHYPVRTQYSTLHMQIRINSGDLDQSGDGRGVAIQEVMTNLAGDSRFYSKDSKTIRYKVTDNLLNNLLMATQKTEHEILRGLEADEGQGEDLTHPPGSGTVDREYNFFLGGDLCDEAGEDTVNEGPSRQSTFTKSGAGGSGQGQPMVHRKKHGADRPSSFGSRGQSVSLSAKGACNLEPGIPEESEMEVQEEEEVEGEVPPTHDPVGLLQAGRSGGGSGYETDSSGTSDDLRNDITLSARGGREEARGIPPEFA